MVSDSDGDSDSSSTSVSIMTTWTSSSKSSSSNLQTRKGNAPKRENVQRVNANNKQNPIYVDSDSEDDDIIVSQVAMSPRSRFGLLFTILHRFFPNAMYFCYVFAPRFG